MQTEGGSRMSGNGGRLFGTDGVRGRANDILTPEIATDLARAAGEGTGGVVAIGRDTRRSSPMRCAISKAYDDPGTCARKRYVGLRVC